MKALRLNYLAAARATGDDAGAYLQAQLTADLTRLGDGAATFSGYCDPKGRLIAVLRVIRLGDEYLLIAAAPLIEPLLAELRKYVLRAKISLSPSDSHVLGSWDENGMQYSIGEPSSDSVAQDNDMVDTWRAQEIRAGVTWLNPASTTQFLPQMIGLERIGGLSFRKGCFPGQEIIARARYLGSVKRRPLIAQVAAHLPAGQGGEVNLLGKNGNAGTGVIVDHAPEGENTVMFLVSRAPEDAPVVAIELNGVRHAVREIVQVSENGIGKTAQT